MNQSGTYTWDVEREKLIRISAVLPSLKRPVYFNKGGTPEFDKSARRTFYSRQERRTWMQAHGLREGGIVNPDHPPV